MDRGCGVGFWRAYRFSSEVRNYNVTPSIDVKRWFNLSGGHSIHNNENLYPTFEKIIRTHLHKITLNSNAKIEKNKNEIRVDNTEIKQDNTRVCKNPRLGL